MTRIRMGLGPGLLLALALAVAACGGGGGNNSGVASLGGSKQPSASSSPGGRLNPAQAALNFARCMREHGVKMSDPNITGTGENADVAQDPLTGVNQRDPRFRPALRACEHDLAAGVVGGHRPDAEHLHRILQFARCMRQRGINVPDPQPDGEFAIERSVRESPAFEAAQRACATYLAGPPKGSG